MTFITLGLKLFTKSLEEAEVKAALNVKAWVTNIKIFSLINSPSQ